MISFPLFKQTVKSSYKILLIILAVLFMYFGLIIGMFDPEVEAQMKALFDTMPEGMVKAFGFDFSQSTLTGFLASYLYGFLMLVFPMIYEIIVGNRLIAKHVDHGSMSYLLASPNNRIKIAVTQMVYLLSSLTILVAIITVYGIGVSEAMFPGQLEMKEFILMNVGVLCLHFAISGICFFASCISNESRISLAIGAGVPIGFYLLQMLANMGGRLENLKYVTVFTLFNPSKVLEGDGFIYLGFVLLAAIGALLYGAGIFLFSKRDLPL